MEAAARRKSESKERMKKAEVVYYLSKNGHLEQPHFMEISIPSSQGLYLRDVIKNLDGLRGKGMAKTYSWSSKRSYKNGYVWHDLAETDFIYPAHDGKEYVLKGTELIKYGESSPCDNKRATRRSSDFDEYKGWKNRRYVIEEEEDSITEMRPSEVYYPAPCSSSSSSGTRVARCGDAENNSGHGGSFVSKKNKTAGDFMQLISRKLKFRRSETISGHGMKGSGGGGEEECLKVNKNGDGFGKIRGLRKSQSCHTQRGSKMEVVEKETDGIQPRCISGHTTADETMEQTTFKK